jgi:hypothetical protein
MNDIARALRESEEMHQLEEDFQRLIVADESRATAAADVLEDAVMHITGLQGAAELRRLLLAIVGLDDLLASGELGPTEASELREIQLELQGFLDGGTVVSADDHVEYAEAIYMIETIYAHTRCDVYTMLQTIHLDMLAAELEAARAAAAVVAAAVAVAEPKERTPEELRREAIAARLQRFGCGST